MPLCRAETTTRACVRVVYVAVLRCCHALALLIIFAAIAYFRCCALMPLTPPMMLRYADVFAADAAEPFDA